MKGKPENQERVFKLETLTNTASKKLYVVWRQWHRRACFSTISFCLHGTMYLWHSFYSIALVRFLVYPIFTLMFQTWMILFGSWTLSEQEPSFLKRTIIKLEFTHTIFLFIARRHNGFWLSVKNCTVHQLGNNEKDRVFLCWHHCSYPLLDINKIWLNNMTESSNLV